MGAATGSVDAVWRIERPEDRDLDRLADHLDDAERSRLARYRRHEDRQRFLAAHGGLRMLLAERLGLAPEQVRLGRAPCPLCGELHGRPIALDDPAGTTFSIAHASGLVLVAVGAAAMGVDVEPTDRSDAADDLGVTLHPSEQALVARLDPLARPAAVLGCWVRTEAYLKGLGTGLGTDPATVAAGPSAGSLEELPGWWVIDLDVGPDHLAALALDATSPSGTARAGTAGTGTAGAGTAATGRGTVTAPSVAVMDLRL